jgi:hypothetical protein
MKISHFNKNLITKMEILYFHIQIIKKSFKKKFRIKKEKNNYALE